MQDGRGPCGEQVSPCGAPLIAHLGTCVLLPGATAHGVAPGNSCCVARGCVPPRGGASISQTALCNSCYTAALLEEYLSRTHTGAASSSPSVNRDTQTPKEQGQYTAECFTSPQKQRPPVVNPVALNVENGGGGGGGGGGVGGGGGDGDERWCVRSGQTKTPACV